MQRTTSSTSWTSGGAKRNDQSSARSICLCGAAEYRCGLDSHAAGHVPVGPAGRSVCHCLGPLAQETVCLAHELGHCETGSFYNQYAALDVRQRHENRADKWAIQHLIPVEDLDEAVVEGCEDIPALSEHFCVTEDLMRKAVCWYTHGNLAAEMYA